MPADYQPRAPKLPEPGGAEALAAGCTCPAGPNDGGAGRVDHEGGRFWTYDTDCRVHFPVDPRAYVS